MTPKSGQVVDGEAGTRVPFLVRWPARVKPGVSDALVCQADFPASFAALTGQKLADRVEIETSVEELRAS